MNWTKYHTDYIHSRECYVHGPLTRYVTFRVAHALGMPGSFSPLLSSKRLRETERLTDWDKFIQHNMTLYRCMISDIHDSSYVLFRTNLISNTSLHVGRPLLRPCLVAYAEATLARQKYSATNEKCWHHFRILIVDKWSVVWNECKKSWVPNGRLEKPLIPCNMISN